MSLFSMPQNQHYMFNHSHSWECDEGGFNFIAPVAIINSASNLKKLWPCHLLSKRSASLKWRPPIPLLVRNPCPSPDCSSSMDVGQIIKQRDEEVFTRRMGLSG